MGDLGGGIAIREKAIALVKEAVEMDKASEYAAAFKLYTSALDHFTVYLKYEKNPMMQQARPVSHRFPYDRVRVVNFIP